MTLLSVVVTLLGVAGVLLATATTLFVGWRRLAGRLRHAPSVLRDLLPHLVVLVLVLLVNRIARHRGQDISWALGWNITDQIHMLEGGVVASIQSIAAPPLTAYFSFMYVYGYVFVTVFPFVAYFALEDTRPLKQTVLAYSLNYALGLVFYTLFISYGPRNLMPDQVQPLLYSSYPEVQLLTAMVNSNTNVFPSLHSSLSVTSALLAHRTADEYPNWYRIALVFAGSIVVSTMYLGIHWATDVVAGACLAYVCVRVAGRYADLRRLWT
ncbi:MAG: phosphatase PAP2 family protein [Haloarculaceae archaeon]